MFWAQIRAIQKQKKKNAPQQQKHHIAKFMTKLWSQTISMNSLSRASEYSIRWFHLQSRSIKMVGERL